MDSARLDMPIGEAMFTQRSIRRFRPDPLPLDDLQLIVEAAVRAPNGGNRQPARFLILTDRALIQQFGGLYREAWWAKRKDEGRPWTSPDEIPESDAERERLRPASWSDYGARAQREYAPRSDIPDLSTGDNVRHSSLGSGIVTRIEPGGVVTVRFEDGSERRLMLEYAPLERV